MRRIPLLLALSMFASSVAAGASQLAPERVDAMVPMSDGVRLDASVYLPAGVADDAQLPLIVRQHGGGSNKDNGYDTLYGLKYVQTGNYALLMYSHRGHGNSEGIFDFFGARTTKDFSEMVDWVAATFGSKIDTTNVGTNGYSQGGGESLLPAEHDSRIKAVAVGQTFADLNQALNPGDCVKLSFSLGIFALAYKTAAARTDDATAVRWGAHMYSDTEDVAAPGQQSATEEMRAHSPIAYLDDLNVPVFWAQAWEDQLFPGEHPEMILEPLRARGVPVHYWFSSGGHAANEDFPAEVAAREAAMMEWFDEFLRGDASRGYASGAHPLVDYWRRTAAGKPGEWVAQTATTYPVATTSATYQATTGGVLAPGEADPVSPNVAIANDLVSANAANDPIVNELDNQSRHNGGPAFAPATSQTPEGPDPVNTATFTSAPLSQPFEMTGAPVVEIDFESTAARVAQVSPKVWDVDPAGNRTLIDRGCLSIEDPAGGHATIKLWPNSHVFRANHRVQLTLSAVDEPTFKADTEPQVMRIQGARLMLPVVA